MKTRTQHFALLQKIKRKNNHPLVHTIHKKYKISKKTLFYIKEYGPHSNITKTIIRESIKILLLSALISALGGFPLEQIKTIFVSLIPLVILLPTLNDLIGDYATIFSARFTTMLHEGKAKGNWLANTELKELYLQVLIIALITASISSAGAFGITYLSGHASPIEMLSKVFLIVIIDVIVLVSTLFILTLVMGTYLYRKKEDPNNMLIPITTSIADFGNMLLLSILVILLF